MNSSKRTQTAPHPTTSGSNGDDGRKQFQRNDESLTSNILRRHFAPCESQCLNSLVSEVTLIQLFAQNFINTVSLLSKMCLLSVIKKGSLLCQLTMAIFLMRNRLKWKSRRIFTRWSGLFGSGCRWYGPSDYPSRINVFYQQQKSLEDWRKEAYVSMATTQPIKRPSVKPLIKRKDVTNEANCTSFNALVYSKLCSRKEKLSLYAPI